MHNCLLAWLYMYFKESYSPLPNCRMRGRGWEGGRHWVSNSYCKGGMVGSGVVIVGRGGEIWDLA